MVIGLGAPLLEGSEGPVKALLARFLDACQVQGWFVDGNVHVARALVEMHKASSLRWSARLVLLQVAM
eukprot:5313921-Lingulodinium_polyedra.AAC.1